MRNRVQNWPAHIWFSLIIFQTEFSSNRLRKRKEKKKKKIEESDDSDEEWSKTREYFQTEQELCPAPGANKRIMFVVDAKRQGNLGTLGLI